MKLILAVILFTASAFASLVGTDPPSSLLVSRGIYEWAWVSPCAPEDPSCGGTLAMHHGFSIATRADWVRDFTGTADIYAAFHPAGQICASPYFNSGYSHCDSVNIDGGGGGSNITIWNAPWGVGNTSYSETFALRQGVIPEPGTYALLGTGMAALALLRLRKRA